MGTILLNLLICAYLTLNWR